MTQLSLEMPTAVIPFKSQLLKWIGNKQRFAHEIVSYFPPRFNSYFEPFLGSGAVLATLAPPKAVASDSFGPLIDIFKTLQENPGLLKRWYFDRWIKLDIHGKEQVYEEVKTSFNSNPNAADLLFLSRSCYGGVIRFRKDGVMSTPCGSHNPIGPQSFNKRVDAWYERTGGTEFKHIDYRLAMNLAEEGDVVYCDPPYSDTQSILYGAQDFSFEDLIDQISRCKRRGVDVALSIDGTKRSGQVAIDLPIPVGLFEREVFVNCGRSMLKRFQMGGQTLESEVVKDRLLLTY
ncbi:MAG: Dam family site-specific DNA-(adenine-N6)-methyltransferase [Acidimicrobiia bacterium]|nr:Dam family site-specific DNA-(adenine-N6)-methyltransferase [Acidimicrobiia bacterium]MCY4434647.1 Dam family site-specific DNA-(adenine-N6)-methyltransferase [bacterium]